MRLLVIGLAALSLAGASSAADPVTRGIYVVSSSGGERRALTSGPWSGIQPSLSPDGRLIAYLSDQLWLMKPDGSEQRPLGTATGERPQWSPDGRRLAYTSWNVSGCYPGPAQKCAVTEVWTVNADGTGERKLLDRAFAPAWSPDGRRLLFRDFLGPAEQGMPAGPLKLMWPDGSHVRTLFSGTAGDGEHSPPAWSPNGKWIAFDRTTQSLEHRLFLIRADGTHLHRLTSGTYPAWSPNGGLIAFERDRVTGSTRKTGVWVIPVTGKQARRITADGRCPTWSPRGKRVAFLTNSVLGGSQLGVVRVDGRGRKVLATAADCDVSNTFPSPPVWSRDGRSIYFVG